MMILRCTSSHTRSQFVRADKNDTDVVAIAYKKQSFVCFCVSAFVSWKKQAAAVSTSATNEDPFQSLSLITSTFFPRENSANCLRVLWINPKFNGVFLSLSLLPIFSSS